MGGGSARSALALASRTLRTRCVTYLPATSASLQLLEAKSLTGRPENGSISGGDQHIFSKDSWQTMLTFAAAGLMAFTGSSFSVAAGATVLTEDETTENAGRASFKSTNPRVIFVLGGPGSGKGTQCAKIVDSYGFVHLSAGDLLRAEINSGSENGTMIQNTIKEGKIVPSEVTVRLLQKAMEECNSNNFLIDGFPRNEENRAVFEHVTGIEPEFILFFDCPEEEMEKRILSRNQGREDDNLETIRKRFKVFLDSTVPVVNHYETTGKVRKINATRSVDDVFDMVQPLFKHFVQDDLLRATEELLRGIDTGDYSTYQRLCHPKLTAFEPEAQGQLVEGLDFHKFYFDLGKALENSSGAHGPAVQSTIVAPKVVLLGTNAGVVTYTRLQQIPGSPKAGHTSAHNETRVWERQKNDAGEWEWKHIHFHRSAAPTT
ncbi:hypothetical protein CY35_01G068400 [Sphagnum magellanicum]|nr:hypothetical protein CY35_01G068400 [Sphagnum magellanicum]KAH9574634.1 hypothetical protein CY35_01G068400 [Sphagnum magellanicum]